MPEHLLGKYDIVHVGLVVLVVEYDNPLPVLDNLLSLLSASTVPSLLFHANLPTSEPGGYVQWDEADFGGLIVNSPNPKIPCAALEEVRKRVLGVCLAAHGVRFEYAIYKRWQRIMRLI